jgi:hypothetical protein
MSARYRGRLVRNDDGTLSWSTTDLWGWVIEGTATKDPAGGYEMTGTLGPTPEALRLPDENAMRESK